MNYFCFLYPANAATPHLEALDSPDLCKATARSSQLLLEHESAVRAEVCEGDEVVAVIHRREDATSIVKNRPDHTRWT